MPDKVIIHIKNQVPAKISFCCGAGEYELEMDQEVDIEVVDGDCMYFDQVEG